MFLAVAAGGWWRSHNPAGHSGCWPGEPVLGEVGRLGVLVLVEGGKKKWRGNPSGRLFDFRKRRIVERIFLFYRGVI